VNAVEGEGMFAAEGCGPALGSGSRRRSTGFAANRETGAAVGATEGRAPA